MVVTLLTDFGAADYFVGAMKGALLSVNHEATVVDITHEIPPQDIEAGAFTLLAAFDAFPPGTIHVAVVDPGVGSSRRAVVVEGGGHKFVGPDNGVFGHVFERVGSPRVFHVTNEKFFRPRVSETFHGRDIFAPVAGALSLGVRAEEFGSEIDDFIRLPFAKPERREDGSIAGTIIHVDRFGNCVTNISRGDLGEDEIARSARLVVGGREIRSFRRFFGEEGDESREPFAIWGSAGLLELAVFRDSAARALGASRGSRVEVKSVP
ncbi:MAG TPA: SAM-dependent chlorinase/fluorinase [Pyrinomonadaceae bacterium]|nr:SAM-dependent chlorinase/fluorinase [Pyrinomonadaceae bacterium]